MILQLNELDELRLIAHEKVKLHKEKTKLWHGRRNLAKHLELGCHVSLYNSRQKLFSGKLKSS